MIVLCIIYCGEVFSTMCIVYCDTIHRYPLIFGDEKYENCLKSFICNLKDCKAFSVLNLTLEICYLRFFVVQVVKHVFLFNIEFYKFDIGKLYFAKKVFKNEKGRI